MATTKKNSGALGVVLLIIVGVVLYYLFSDDNGGNPNPNPNPPTDYTSKIVGKWKMGEHDIIFGSDLSYKDNGDFTEYDFGEYSVDFNQNPAWINIVSRKNYNYTVNGFNTFFFAGIPKQSVGRGIIRFISDNEIELVFDYALSDKFGSHGVNYFIELGDNRPSSFDTSEIININTYYRNDRIVGWQPVSLPCTGNTIKLILTRVLD